MFLEEGRVGVTLGRHTNDFMTSFYARTPSSFMIECGWGGREIDPATWQPVEMHDGPSLWGHERVWLPPGDRVVAREMRMRAAASGLRAPVQVMEVAPFYTMCNLAPGGRVVVLTTFPDRGGVLSPRELVFAEASVVGSRYASKAEVATAAELVASGRIRPVIGATTGPDDVLDLHTALRDGALTGRGALVWR